MVYHMITVLIIPCAQAHSIMSDRQWPGVYNPGEIVYSTMKGAHNVQEKKKNFSLLWVIFLAGILFTGGCGGGSGDSGAAYYGGGDSGGTTQNHSVSGTFRDAANTQPVQGATCTLTQTRRASFIEDFMTVPKETVTVNSTTTDQNGQYSFTGVPSGTYTMQITKSGYVTISVDNLVVNGDITGLSQSSPQVAQWNAITGTGCPYDAAKTYMIVTAALPGKDASRTAGISATITPNTGVQTGYMTDATPSVVDWNATATFNNGQVFFGNLIPGTQYTITFTYLGTAYSVVAQSGTAPGTMSMLTVTLSTVSPSPSPTTSPSSSPSPSPSSSASPSPSASPSASPTQGGGGGGGGTPPTYTVTYDGNGNTGGDVPVDGTKYPQGGTVTVLGNTGSLVKTGFTFTGWNTKADGSGTDYAAPATFAIGTANVTLYAKWTADPTYTVTYDGNGKDGGDVPVDGNAYLEGASVTVSGNTGSLVKAGSTFAGWNTKADGSGDDYASPATFFIGPANVILYAKWTADPTYTVTYDGNGKDGGDVPLDGNAYTAGATVTVSGNTGLLVKSGFVFAGWNTRADGSGTNRAVNSTFAMGAGNVILYAQWAIPTYKVTYNGNGSTEGTAPEDNNTYLQGATVTVLGNGTLVKIQEPITFRFTGWNTQADGLGTVYNEDDPFTMGNADVTLYAQWTAIRCTGPAGGLIFYDKGAYSDGWRYMEAAPSDQSLGIAWGNDVADLSTVPDIGKGKTNTATIVAHYGAGITYAAGICDALTINGCSDWFLPSKDELNAMYVNLKAQGVGGFENIHYWSSSENYERGSGGDATTQHFDNGWAWCVMKSFTEPYVRAARRF